MWWVGQERNTIKGEWTLHKVPQMARITKKPEYGSMSADVQRCSTNIRLRGTVIKVPEGQTNWTEYLYLFIVCSLRELKSVSHVQQTASNYSWTVSHWLLLQANKNKWILLVNSSFCSGCIKLFKGCCIAFTPWAEQGHDGVWTCTLWPRWPLCQPVQMKQLSMWCLSKGCVCRILPCVDGMSAVQIWSWDCQFNSGKQECWCFKWLLYVCGQQLRFTC